MGARILVVECCDFHRGKNSAVWTGRQECRCPTCGALFTTLNVYDLKDENLDWVKEWAR